MKVYISGPITGTADYMERFDKVERFLKSQNHIPYNPAKLNSIMPPETTYEGYMGVAMAMMKQCEAVYMMKGWKSSKGSTMEHRYAVSWRFKRIYEEER